MNAYKISVMQDESVLNFLNGIVPVVYTVLCIVQSGTRRNLKLSSHKKYKNEMGCQQGQKRERHITK
jgi:hypothetical protein